jgi:hypothetical protein
MTSKVIEGHKSSSNFSVFSNTFFFFLIHSFMNLFLKIYMNANIMNTEIFYLIKYDLKGH